MTKKPPRKWASDGQQREEELLYEKTMHMQCEDYDDYGAYGRNNNVFERTLKSEKSACATKSSTTIQRAFE